MQGRETRYSRGYLPHFDIGRVPQFITFRLADSLPRQLIDQWEQELAQAAEEERKREMYRRVEKHLDLGQGSCILRYPIAGRIVEEAIRHYDGKKYNLHAWCVMPNHVHMLVTPFELVALADFVRPIKSYSSRQIHLELGGKGRLWQRDYFDRFARNDEHFLRIWKYIEWNPVKAQLVREPAQWPHSSAFDNLRRPNADVPGCQPVG
jgi:REP element-mobilizing transposase RayT